jgi:chromosomal replication initiator protein
MEKMADKQIWQAVLGELEVSLSRANFTTWFKNTSLTSNNDTYTIFVPNGFTKEWLQNKYNENLLKAIKKVAGKVKNINYAIHSTSKSQEKIFSTPKIDLRETEEAKNGSLNPRYVFETFIVGDGNKLAHAACQAVVKKPGEIYNPLFIYGGVGLGKTHLMQALGNAIVKKNIKKKVVYVTCEKFVNEFIQAISTGRMNRFKGNYRNVDVLLIDDIQFLAGKEGTQEEFFHTFNTLHQNDKQIVISSDRPPKALHTLEDRLISRFEWGMIADIAPPDIETRMAILKSKCQEKKYKIDPRALNYIASNIQQNIRELEGALNRLIAYCELNDLNPDLETTENALGSFITASKKNVNAEQIIKEVASFYSLDKEKIMEKKRNKEIVVPRQISMYLMREEINQPYTRIAEIFGGKDHTTVMHAYNKIKINMQKNKSLKQEVELIKQKIYSSR